MKNPISLFFVVMLVVAAFAVFMFYKPEPDLRKMGPLTYEVDDSLVSVELGGEVFVPTIAEFRAMKQECGDPDPDNRRLSELVDAFTGEQMYRYRFTPFAPHQDPGTFIVSVLPNKFGYESLETVRADFDQCYAGGDRYPRDVNDDWIMFVGGCGTGFSDDSGLPIGCMEAFRLVSPTLGFRE